MSGLPPWGEPAGVVGIDLSGPANFEATSAALFAAGPGRMELRAAYAGADDALLLEVVRSFARRGPVAVGVDAPLSYHPGGGDRPGDRRLRRRLVAAGLPPGCVMAPTLTRMAYLTLRGMAVSRLLVQGAGRRIRIVETHPAGALVLGGCPPEPVRRLKSSGRARSDVLAWLGDRGLRLGSRLQRPTDHDVAACAAAYGAWKWAVGAPAWIEPARTPLHPFDYAC
jgi:predicted nuclease with RNAse H fold